jgi:cell division septal protein FtsQ
MVYKEKSVLILGLVSTLLFSSSLYSGLMPISVSITKGRQQDLEKTLKEDINKMLESRNIHINPDKIQISFAKPLLGDGP